MANTGLIERIMHWPGSEGEMLSGHTAAAGIEVIEDEQVSLIQFKAALNITPGDPSDQDIDNLRATVTGTQAERNRRIAGIAAAFMLADAEVTGYNTPSAVRTRLGIATPS